MRFLMILIIFFFIECGFCGQEVAHYNWNGLPVTHVIDESLPLYDALFSFESGHASLATKPGHSTGLMYLKSNLENRYKNGTFYTSPEYSYFHLFSLSKDFIPLLDSLCHRVFNEGPSRGFEASFAHDLSDYSSTELAEMLLRKLQFGSAEWGKFPSRYDQISTEEIKQSLLNIRSRPIALYLYGPSLPFFFFAPGSCHWKNVSKIKDEIITMNRSSIHWYYVVDPTASQVYWTAGRSLKQQELPSLDQAFLLNEYFANPQLGVVSTGLRQKKGLIYSFEPYFSIFPHYGRVGFRTRSSTTNVGEFWKTLSKLIRSYHHQVPDQRTSDLIRSFSLAHQALSIETGAPLLKDLAYKKLLRDLGPQRRELFPTLWNYYYNLDDWYGVVVGPPSIRKELSRHILFKEITRASLPKHLYP